VFAVDSSVLVAALLAHHPLHGAALDAVNDRVDSLPAHVLLESYSVLTRLPAEHRLEGRRVAEAFMQLDLTPLVLPARQQVRALAALAAAGIEGGAVYDGLVAATAQHHDRELLTMDRRARSTYQKVGVAYTLMI
jgi:predicted nucleic acid-binding protein